MSPLADHQLDQLKKKIDIALLTEVSDVGNDQHSLCYHHNNDNHNRSSSSLKRWNTISMSLAEKCSAGLSEVPVDSLIQCLKPIMDGLASVDAEVLLELERITAASGEQGAILHDGVFVRSIHNQILPAIAVDEEEHVVRYLHLSELEGVYSMGMFIFPPHARIPLHDHPGMCVLSRLLYGDIHRLQLDLCREQPSTLFECTDCVAVDSVGTALNEYNAHGNEDDSNEEPIVVDCERGGMDNFKRLRDFLRQGNKDSLSAKGKPPNRKYLQLTQSSMITTTATTGTLAIVDPPVSGAKRAIMRQVDHLQAPDTTILFPFEGNLHEFVAGPYGAAVMDILLPPYDIQHCRNCTFYEIREDLNKEQPHQQHLPLQHNEDGTRTVLPTDGTSCWIIPTEQPEDFHCTSGRYRNSGV